MKKFVIILPLVMLIAGCVVIDERYTGPRVKVEPDERDAYYEYYPSYYGSYSGYYDPFYYPYSWIGLSWWNPFWYYGFRRRSTSDQRC